MQKPCALFEFPKVLIIIFLLSHGLIANGQSKREKGEMRNGRREGLWEYFYPDGRIMARENYLNGEQNGLSTGYFPDGTISQLENWKNDLQQDSSWYFHPNGKLFRKGLYESGVYQGLWFSFYANGKLEQSGGYLNGMPEGLFQNWYENGGLKEEGYYRDGKKDGQFIFYRPQKTRIQLVANYFMDKPCGTWIYFNRRGKKGKAEPAPVFN